MTSLSDLLNALLIGAGGTVALDIWVLFMTKVLHTPGTNWSMVGRWLGHMASGQFVQQNLGHAAPIKHEAALGWLFHYIVGVTYGLPLLAFWGHSWLAQPTLLPPLIVAWALLIAPFFIMMPGMGNGIAGRKTPKPNVTRLKSVVGHFMFGLGMYATALVLTGIA